MTLLRESELLVHTEGSGVPPGKDGSLPRVTMEDLEAMTSSQGDFEQSRQRLQLAASAVQLIEKKGNFLTERDVSLLLKIELLLKR